MRKLLLPALFAAAFAPGARAVEAVHAPANVIEFDVIAVAVPARLPSYCAVSAVVGLVWQGGSYRAGQPVTLNVPCAEYGLVPANARDNGFTPVNARTLQQSQRGIARLDDKGELIWNQEGLRPYGPWGAVAGYRVIDARMLPQPIRS